LDHTKPIADPGRLQDQARFEETLQRQNKD